MPPCPGQPFQKACFMAHFNPGNRSNRSLRATGHLPQRASAGRSQIQIAQGQGDLDNPYLGAIDLEATVDGIEAGVVICDRQRAITVMNRAARRLLLPEANTPITLDAVAFYRPGIRVPLPPDDLPLWLALAGEAVHDLELAIVHPQGDRYVVLAGGQPLTGPGGEVQGAIMTLYDITQRYKAESMLRSSNLGLKTEAHQRLEDLQAVNEKLRQESAQRQQAELALQRHRDYLQTIFDTEPACVKVMNSAGQIQFVNLAGLALLGVSEASQLLGQPMQPLVAPEWQEAYWAFHQRICAGEKSSLEYEIINRRGDRHWVESHATPLVDEITEQPLHLSVTRDITQRKRAEQALRESEHLFSTIANASPALVWMAGTDGLCVYFNDPWLTFRGRQLPEELGNGWVEGVHPDDLARCLDTYTTAFAARQPFSMEYRLRRYDGQYRWIVDSGMPRYATNGNFVGYIGTCLDVSDRKQEEATRRLFFDLPFIGMAITSPTTKRWVQINDCLCDILGYSQAELQQMTWAELTHSDDLAADVAQFSQVLRGEADGYTLDKRFIRKDGATIYTTIDVKCLRQDDGAIEFFVATVQDITDRRRAEQHLRDSEERFRATFEQAAVGIAHMAPDGTWLWVNQTLCTLVGYSHDELLGLTFQAITHPDDLATDLDYVHEMLAGQRQHYTMEKRYLRKDQSIVWVQITVSLVRDEQQQPKYFISVIQDITAAKQADETLRHYAQRLQGLHTMDRAILAQFQPPGVARSALKLLCQLLDCRQGIVTLFDREAQQGEIIADAADDALFPAGTRLPLADFVFAQSAGRCRMRRVKSIAQLKYPPLIFQCFLATDLRSAMTVPLLVNGNVIGEVTLADHRRDHFRADDEEVIQEVTDHLAIALQSARLFEQVTADRQRLKDLSSQLLETQETERRVLAHELHDEIGQALTAVKLSLRRLERLVEPALAKSVLDDCVAITDGALQQVRNLSLDLRPSMLDDLGLVPALRWYVSRHAERTGLVERFTCDADLSELSVQIKTACFRIVQESLTNIARHAQAQTVTIALVVAAQCLHLTIQDDGVGFDIDALRYAKSHGTSLGLLGMEERSLLIGGHLSFTSAPGQGTGVNLWVPLSSA
ncbi:MAG: hypothetical protein DCF32_08495 [Leptolyngbya sp.]|nr:MAG: hypothetical protein DCF32_08495 [Leptolyngbya sp.]